LKLIDFGLAKFNSPGEKMSVLCGSDHYMAPEVMHSCYTQKVDLWSLGVIVYVMMTGRFLFTGPRHEVRQKIRKGACDYGPRFFQLSQNAQDFVQSLLALEPEKRMVPSQALCHPWLRSRAAARQQVPLTPTLLTRLRHFALAPTCERQMALLMAWSLSAEDQVRLSKQFMAFDTGRTGTISLNEFKAALEDKFALQDTREAEALFKSLDTDGNDRIEYREFLAAAASEKAKFHSGTVRRTFARFDRDGDGVVSRGELASILEGSCTNSDFETFFCKADTSGDGKLSYEEFRALVTHRKPGGCASQAFE